jgi:hypothetical protein
MGKEGQNEVLRFIYHGHKENIEIYDSEEGLS